MPRLLKERRTTPYDLLSAPLHAQEAAPPLHPRADNGLVGQQVGSWLLQRLLGKGGMSAVYEGVHTTTQQLAAIKLLHASHLHDQDNLLRFAREADALHQLDHPNIVDIYEYNYDPVFGHFMALERLVGQDLGALMDCHSPLPTSWLLEVVEQVCDALQEAHSKSIIHRDLKPANIFLQTCTDGVSVKLLDFGIAKVQHQQDRERLTATGAILGTPAYLAPEQIKSHAQLTPATDLYALGVILYEALTGRLPIEGDAGFEHLLRVVQAIPATPGSHRPELADTELEEVIMRMLAKDPLERPSSIELCWNEISIASQFFEDPYDLPEHTPIVQEALPLTTAPVSGDRQYRPIVFRTDGEQIEAVSLESENYFLARQQTQTSTLTSPQPHKALPQRSSAERPATQAPPSRYRMSPIIGTLGTSLVLSLGGWWALSTWQARSLPAATHRDATAKVGLPGRAPASPTTNSPATSKSPQDTPAKIAPKAVQPKQALSPQGVLQQARALQQYQQAHLALQRANRAAKQARFANAHKYSAAFVQHWQRFQAQDQGGVAAQLSVTPRSLAPTFRRWRQLATHQQQIARHHTRAQFAEASRHRQAFLKLLGSHPRQEAIRKQGAEQRAKEARGTRLLQQATSAYRGKRWQRAYKYYTSFERLFPRAWNRHANARFIKACSCALKLKPWEICTPANYPRGWHNKRQQP